MRSLSWSNCWEDCSIWLKMRLLASGLWLLAAEGLGSLVVSSLFAAGLRLLAA